MFLDAIAQVLVMYTLQSYRRQCKA